MAMNRSILKRIFLYFIITTLIATTITNSQELKENNPVKQNSRPSRAVARKPGFFKTLFSVVYEQWNDTWNTTRTIKNMIDDNFLPENAPKVETTTSSDPNASTTEAPYKITRSEFNRIVMRNLRGLIRLYNLELRDALRQSDVTNAQLKKNASAEISKFL